MKKALKISSIVIGTVLFLMLILPFAFRGKIKEQLQKEINRSLNARVNFDGVGLSLFSHFPDMTLSLKNLTIAGVGDFSRDTLLDVPSFSLTLNLMSVVRGKEYEVKQLWLNKPEMKLKVLKNGKVNWDIMKPSETSGPAKAPSAFKVLLNRVELQQAVFIYDDAETPLYFALNGLDAALGGDMTSDLTSLKIEARAAEVALDYSGIRYIRKTSAGLDTKLEADLNKWIFRFKGAKLQLNDLEFLADGFFAMPDDGYDMDIKFAAKENSFKNFLSLVPGMYTKDFASVRAAGSLAFDGFVKGKYTGLLIPSFGLNLKIDNGSFSYPSLPGSVKDINVRAAITNPDGNTDHTLVDVSKLQLLLMQNPVDASFTLKNPVSDPEINGMLKGKMDLSELSKFYPLGNKTSLSGLLTADITLNGKMSSVERGQYDQFKASGTASVEKLSYSGPDLPQSVQISSARLEFSPAFLSLPAFSMKIGKNDLTATGRIENYLPYFLKKNAVLKGSLTTNSSWMDLNSLITGKPAATAQEPAKLSVVEVPGNIDLTLNSRFSRLLYADYDMQNASGTIRVKDKTIFLDGLSVTMLGGSMALTGSYNTFDPARPRVDMNMNLKAVNIRQAYKAFNTMQSFAPVAEKLNGNVTTNLKLSGDLSPQMMPVLTSLSGAGLVLSDALAVENVNLFNQIAEVLKIEKLRKPSIEKVNLSFDLVDGKATVKPMDFKLASYKSNFSGTIGLDQVLNFVLHLDIPRSEFGDKANGVLSGLVSDASRKGLAVKLGDMVPVTLLIGGTVTNPKVTAGIKQAMAGVVEDLKQQAAAQVQQKKEEVIAKAKDEANKLIEQADAQAAKILQTAQLQSDQLIKTARITADRLKAQADSSAGKVLSEGKKNGMIAEIAAKKVSEKIKKESELKAGKLLEEAQLKSDAIMNKARAEAGQLKQQARSQAK